MLSFSFQEFITRQEHSYQSLEVDHISAIAHDLVWQEGKKCMT